MLPGSQWETPLYIHHSGVAGKTVMFLGGVHGNEPGGWQAADEVAAWRPEAGTLIVLPRANKLAMASFVRTFEEIGDLNRLYPGTADSQFAMERMAASIVAVAREFEADLLIDMHESWGFYIDYPGTGTTALGQTLTAGVGPLNPTFTKELAAKVNPLITERERFLDRDGLRFAGGTVTPVAGSPNRGRSSLGLGNHVPGLTPILVEMGQETQTVERRVQLHLIVARAALEMTSVVRA
jgi:hypothetical protein